MNVPSWAQALVARVAADYPERIPANVEVTWRTSRKKAWYQRRGQQPRYGRRQSSSGHAQRYLEQDGRAGLGQLTVIAGSERRDQKLVLLHELAHLLVPAREGHSSTFWDMAFELFRRYGVPMRYALERERNYRQGAAEAYSRNKIAPSGRGLAQERKGTNMAGETTKVAPTLTALEAGFTGKATRSTPSKPMQLVHKVVDGKTLCGGDVTVVTPNMVAYKESWKASAAKAEVSCQRCLRAINGGNGNGAKPTPIAKKETAKKAETKSHRVGRGTAQREQSQSAAAIRGRAQRAAKKAAQA